MLFHGDQTLECPSAQRLSHLAALSHQLAAEGALAALGTPTDEVALLLDCVSCSHWQLVGSGNVFLATRGSRPGDGLADILFGALFAIALRHIRTTCAAENIAHASAGALIGRPDEVIPIGWADDLAVLADFESPRELQAQVPRLADIVIGTLEHLRFRVNLGVGKTEALVEIRGVQAKATRGDMLSGASALALPDGRSVRLAPEYKYLGVVQQPRDNGRRDQELNLQRGQAAWAHARSLFASPVLPFALKQAWLAGRVLPAAYATLACSVAVSRRATSPLEGFFERSARALLGTWQYGHLVSKPCLYAMAGLTAPAHALLVARVRLVTQLCLQAPLPVWELFDASWNRATSWHELLVDACRQVLVAVPGLQRAEHVTLDLMRHNSKAFANACKHVSRFGTCYWAFWELWQDLGASRTKQGHWSSRLLLMSPLPLLATEPTGTCSSRSSEAHCSELPYAVYRWYCVFVVPHRALFY